MSTKCSPFPNDIETQINFLPYQPHFSSKNDDVHFKSYFNDHKLDSKIILNVINKLRHFRNVKL